MTPEVTFKRIIEQYKQLTGAGGGLTGSVGTPRLSVVKDILLERGTGASEGEAGASWVVGAGGGGAGAGRRARGGGGVPSRQEERGDIIKFYNKVGGWGVLLRKEGWNVKGKGLWLLRRRQRLASLQ